MKQRYIMSHELARQRAIDAVRAAPAGYVIEIREPTRTLDQNALLWPLLTEVSRQVDWYGQKLTEDEWKDVFTAGLRKQKAVPGIDGGFVMVGSKTSRMNKREFSELVELIYAFGAERGVKFQEAA
jgi:hypothetical protein